MINTVKSGWSIAYIEESHVIILEENAIGGWMKLTDVSEIIDVERKASELINPFGPMKFSRKG